MPNPDDREQAKLTAEQFWREWLKATVYPVKNRTNIEVCWEFAEAYAARERDTALAERDALNDELGELRFAYSMEAMHLKASRLRVEKVEAERDELRMTVDLLMERLALRKEPGE